MRSRPRPHVRSAARPGVPPAHARGTPGPFSIRLPRRPPLSTSRARTSDITTLAWPRERDACGVGFIADLHGRRERRVLEHALEALANLAHRGAVSADGKTGDGAGILTQLPYRILQRDLARAGIVGVPDDELAVGMFFVANDANWRRLYEVIEEVLEASELRVLMWRDPPVDAGALGELALSRRPVLKQAVLGVPPAWTRWASSV